MKHLVQVTRDVVGYRATPLGLPDAAMAAATREEAIRMVIAELAARVARRELVPVEIPDLSEQPTGAVDEAGPARAGELVVGVDTGRILVVDPCYVDEPDLRALVLAQVENAPEGQLVTPLAYDDGRPGLGVMVHAGYGDGTYDVEVETFTDPEWSRHPMVRSVTIRFA